MPCALLFDADVPDDFLCPITYALMQEPVVAEDGYTYERAGIEGWCRTRQAAGQPVTSPISRAAIDPRRLVDNRALRNLIALYREQTSQAAAVHPSPSTLVPISGAATGLKTTTTAPPDGFFAEQQQQGREATTHRRIRPLLSRVITKKSRTLPSFEELDLFLETLFDRTAAEDNRAAISNTTTRTTHTPPATETVRPVGRGDAAGSVSRSEVEVTKGAILSALTDHFNLRRGQAEILFAEAIRGLFLYSCRLSDGFSFVEPPQPSQYDDAFRTTTTASPSNDPPLPFPVSSWPSYAAALERVLNELFRTTEEAEVGAQKEEGKTSIWLNGLVWHVADQLAIPETRAATLVSYAICEGRLSQVGEHIFLVAHHTLVVEAVQNLILVDESTTRLSVRTDGRNMDDDEEDEGADDDYYFRREEILDELEAMLMQENQHLHHRHRSSSSSCRSRCGKLFWNALAAGVVRERCHKRYSVSLEIRTFICNQRNR